MSHLCSDQEVEDERVFKNKEREFPVCDLATREKIKRHILKKHLPWFWSGTTACWDCGKQEIQASSLALRHTSEHRIGCFFHEEHLHLWCQLVNGVFHLMKTWFGCTDLEDLLQYVLGRMMHDGVRSSFNEQEHQLVLFYVQVYSPDGLSQITVNPPNHVISLTNWELMTTMLRRVGPQQQQSLVSCYSQLTYEGHPMTAPVSSPAEPFLFVDAHFHLDLVQKRLHFNSFLHMESKMSPANNNNSFYYGIANYVFPHHWNHGDVQVGPARSVYVSFGIHPHVAAQGVTSKQLEDLDFLLGNHKCVTVGEIGLDYASRCNCRPCRTPEQCGISLRECQERAFIDMLLIAW